MNSKSCTDCAHFKLKDTKDLAESMQGIGECYAVPPTSFQAQDGNGRVSVGSMRPLVSNSTAVCGAFKSQVELEPDPYDPFSTSL